MDGIIPNLLNSGLRPTSFLPRPLMGAMAPIFLQEIYYWEKHVWVPGDILFRRRTVPTVTR